MIEAVALFAIAIALYLVFRDRPPYEPPRCPRCNTELETYYGLGAEAEICPNYPKCHEPLSKRKQTDGSHHGNWGVVVPNSNRSASS